MPSKKVSVVQYECSHCGRTWFPRNPLAPKPPKICPTCKNPDWDAPKQQVRA